MNTGIPSISIALVATVAYLPQALTACEMLHQKNQHVNDYFILVPDILESKEKIENSLNISKYSFNVTLLSPEDCDLSYTFKSMTFYYTALELCCALKPVILNYINKSTSFKYWIYIDSDIYCLNDLNPILNELENSSIFLTAHRNKPFQAGVKSVFNGVDSVLYSSGSINAGVIGIKRSEFASEFIDWFERTLIFYCFDDWRISPNDRVEPKTTLFLDQRWLDLAPTYFDGVIVSRDRGHNCAYWNMDGDDLRDGDEGVYCGEDLVIFLHLSEFNIKNPVNYGNINYSKNLTWCRIMEEYLGSITRNTPDNFQMEYGYSNYQDGQKITRQDRHAYLKLILMGKKFGDVSPFELNNLIKSTSNSFTTYDYISSGLLKIELDHAFPFMIEGKLPQWRHIGVEATQKFYVDLRFPNTGFVSRDEAHILFNLAQLFPNKPALEIGCWMGWSAAHIASSAISELHIIDPILNLHPWNESIQHSFNVAGLINKCFFYPTTTPEGFYDLPDNKWGFIFIDGNHEGDAPLTDAVFAQNIADLDSMIVLHDLRSPDVSSALSYLRRMGWNVGLYLTTQIMAVAWRGNILPITHYRDVNYPINIPLHLDEFPILSQ